jgi:hypothetical protein
MKLLDKNKKEVEELDLGIVEVNTTKEYEYILLNDVDAELNDIDLSINNKEINIIDCPKSLKSLANGIIKFSWTPTLKITKGVKTTFSIRATELYKL